MREEESNWFSKWEEELPSPEELTPLSQSLISPDLALAFNIPTGGNHPLRSTPTPPPPPPPHLPHSAGHSSQPTTNSSAEFDSPDPGAAAADEPARTLKRPRLVWTPQLHKRFVDAVAHLGIKNAVPKTIMQLMSVDGLTRENVASHLQKYRLYLKRMQGMSGGGGAAASVDPATDHLFATSPVPAHFLHPGRAPANSDHFFVPVAASAAVAMPHHHHHPMTVVGAAAQHHPHHLQIQGPFRHFGSSPANGQYEHPFMRQPPRMAAPVPVHAGNGAVMAPAGFSEDLESAGGGNGRKVLTLFPTGDD